MWLYHYKYVSQACHNFFMNFSFFFFSPAFLIGKKNFGKKKKKPDGQIMRIQELQKMLIQKTQIVVDKDVLIQDKERLYVELKNILARQPGPEVAEQLEVYGKKFFAYFGRYYFLLLTDL